MIVYKEEKMKEIIVDAVIGNLNTVTEFVNESLKGHGVPERLQMKIDIAIDELFSNIVKYSYGDKGGKVTVRVEVDAEKASITFIDEGIEYNPLNQPEPDLSLTADDEAVGGLGIFITKKIMDDIQYEYSDGKNILIIHKKSS